jgi:hypothetical protein
MGQQRLHAIAVNAPCSVLDRVRESERPAIEEADARRRVDLLRPDDSQMLRDKAGIISTETRCPARSVVIRGFRNS